ncbi:substrate-binding domain-containing protein [Breznakiellaceae bacterium SP9]
MKKLAALLLIACVSTGAAFAGGGQQGGTGGKIKIGVSMPTKSLQRWNQDGANMQKQLEAQGYSVDLQYGGDNDIPTQVAQIENMINGGVKAIVIAAIDGSSLTRVLQEAKKNNIRVIAYDRLIMNSNAVDYYATFDNYKVGQMQGQYIVSKLGLETVPGTFNIELVTGAPDDNNVKYFFGGAMDVLNPYITSGKLQVLSGQKEIAQVATPNWSTEESQKRFENLITANRYGPYGTSTKLDAVLCSNDSTANGVTNALIAAGYTSANFPIVTGQDCDLPSVKNLQAGTQTMSVFKDTRILAAKVVEMVNAIAKGTTVSVNDTKTYNNGVKVVPSFQCDPIVVEKADIQKVLIDGGYYQASEIN